MEAKFKKVTSDDFDVDVLLKAYREGYLYFSVDKTTEDIKQDILFYVSKIAAYARPQYVGHYIDIWKDILDHPEFSICGFYIKKGNNKGLMNKRKVFAVVRRLNDACGLYSTCSLALAKALEGTMSKPSIYTSSSSNGSYVLTWGQMQTVARIVERYKRN